MVETTDTGEAHETAKDRVSLSEENLFTEWIEANGHIKIIINGASSEEQKDEALGSLRNIYDKYLECPRLLDRHVAPMVVELMGSSIETIRKNSYSSGDLRPIMHSLSALYALSKVRGRKRVQKCLSHEVEDVEPVLQALRSLADESSKIDRRNATSNNDQSQLWESLYVLWNWLGTLSLIPFDCKVVFGDSRLILSLIELGKQHLSETGPTREAAAASLASWLSRPDLETSNLPEFVSWCKDIVHSSVHQKSTLSKDVFLILGAVQCLVTILKVSTSPRENILAIMQPLWDPFIALSESSLCDSNMILRKLMIKWWSRMGCAYLPPKVALWRYHRGRRSLAENLVNSKLQPSSLSNTICNESIGATPGIQQKEYPLPEIPDQVEDAIGFVLEGLCDKATSVRWSAAKGTGRLTERLPSVCADDVLDAILELFLDPEKDQSWHGACLALAELARRGLLLPHRVGEVIPVIVRAIQYDVTRGQSSVGAHVRDAACYTYWAFARAYTPEVLRPFIRELSESIVITCLFDREVNCRRAASAAFQECVGRQGADNFKHGISILTTADYFALGNRNNSFTTIAFHVAQFPEYQKKIINHIYRVKLHHWDENVRELSSKSLNGLTTFDQQYFVETVIPSLLETCLDPKNIPIRHGSILGLGEIILALGKSEDGIEGHLSKSVLAELAEIVPTIEKNRLYRGRGGEIVRGAVCRLICCICTAKVPMVARQQVRLLDSIDACLPHPNESIQEKACEALQQLTRNYFPVGPNGPSDRLQDRVVDKYIAIVKTTENPASSRGFSLALGYLPRKLLAPGPFVLESVVNSLCQKARYDSKVGNEKDAETRRNALVALRRLCQTVGTLSVSVDRGDVVKETSLDKGQVSRVFQAFLTGLKDYNVDRRGDVGSWCRIEAMKGLKALTLQVIEEHGFEEDLPDYFSASLSATIIGALLKQFAEKLDSARVEAGKCLERILHKGNPEVPFIPQKANLQKCLGLLDSDDNEHQHTHRRHNWADASLTFPLVGNTLDIPEFFPAVLAGMVISVGGLTESVAKHSSTALLHWTKGAKGSKRLQDLGDVLLGLFKDHSREGRVILPLLKTFDLLLSHQCLDELLLNDNSNFKETLLAYLTMEAKRCNDVHRLFACIDVALGLVVACSESQNQNDGVLAFVCTMLAHRFPRVRKYTAEHVYVSLLENMYLILQKDDESILDYLLNAPWHTDLNALQCSEMAQKVGTVLGVYPLLDLGSFTNDWSGSLVQKPAAKDDFESYAALVESSKD